MKMIIIRAHDRCEAPQALFFNILEKVRKICGHEAQGHYEYCPIPDNSVPPFGIVTIYVSIPLTEHTDENQEKIIDELNALKIGRVSVSWDVENVIIAKINQYS